MNNFRLRPALRGLSSRLSRGTFAAAAVLAVTIFATAFQSASASPITLGSASNYGLLLGTSDTLKANGNFNLAGNIGFGNNDTLNKSGGANSVSGNEYHDSNLTTTASGGATFAVSGSTITQSMTSVISAANSASTTAGALSGTSGFATSYQGSSISLSSSSVTLNAVTTLSENVLDISNLSLSNSTLTLNDNGQTGAKFIINVSGTFSISGTSSIKITGTGASGADVIFNIEGTGSTVSITNSGNIVGTILAPSRSVTLSGGGSLTGALIAGVSNASSVTVQTTGSSGYNITSLGYVPRTVSTPEPSSIALFGAGVSALIAARRRRRSK